MERAGGDAHIARGRVRAAERGEAKRKRHVGFGLKTWGVGRWTLGVRLQIASRGAAHQSAAIRCVLRVCHESGRLVDRGTLQDRVAGVEAETAAWGGVAVGDGAPHAQPEEAPQHRRRAPLVQTGQRLRVLGKPLGDNRAVRAS